MAFHTYMLASRRNGTLYVGFTEQHETREAAFQRERRLKNWNRAWKLELIERFNPAWRDLYETLQP